MAKISDMRLIFDNMLTCLGSLLDGEGRNHIHCTFIFTSFVYKSGLKSSYDDVIYAAADFFWLMEFKHCNTDGRSMWTTREIVEK